MYSLDLVQTTLDKYGLHLDAKQVLRKIGGRRPGKRCKNGWIAAEKQCSDHKTKDGKLTAAGKDSARELAARVRDRKGMLDRTSVTRKQLVGLDDRIEAEQKANTARKTAATKAKKTSSSLSPDQERILDADLGRFLGADRGEGPSQRRRESLEDAVKNNDIEFLDYQARQIYYSSAGGEKDREFKSAGDYSKAFVQHSIESFKPKPSTSKSIDSSQLNAGDRKQAVTYNEQGAQRAKNEGRSDSFDRRWDSACDRLAIRYGWHLDDWKRIGRNQMGQPCGRGWVGLRGACKRGKKSEDNTAKIKESKVALAGKIKANKVRDRLKKENSQQPNSPQGRIIDVPLSSVNIDKKRFGSTSEADKKTLPKFNANYAGAIQTWQDPKDGKTYVVNGFKRLESAKKSGESSISTMPIKAKTAEDAREIGAFSNLASGTISGIAAGQFFRDSKVDETRLKKEGIDIEHPNIKQGLGLAKLDEGSYKMVLSGEITPKAGEILGSSPLTQAEKREITLEITPKPKIKGKVEFLENQYFNLINDRQREGYMQDAVREKLNESGRYVPPEYERTYRSKHT